MPETSKTTSETSSTGTESNKIYVRKIPATVQQDKVREFFGFAGKIRNLSLEKDGDVQEAIVEYEKSGSAKTARILNGSLLGGAHILVQDRKGRFPPAEPEAHRPSEVAKALAGGIFYLKKVPFYDQMSGLVVKAKDAALDVNEKFEISAKLSNAASVVAAKAAEVNQSYKIHEKIEAVKPLSATIAVLAGVVYTAANEVTTVYKDTACLVSESDPSSGQQDATETQPNVAKPQPNVAKPQPNVAEAQTNKAETRTNKAETPAK